MNIKNVLNYKRPRFWAAVMAVLAVSAICAVLIKNPGAPTKFNGASYSVKEIMYQAPEYSFAYTLDTAPQFCISSDYVLYSKHSDYEDWIMHDGLYSYEISRQDLYELFNPIYYDTRREIDKAKLIYRADINDSNHTFYMVMQLKNGDVLLAAGYDYEDNPRIRWLFKLEKFDEELSYKNSDTAKSVEEKISIIMSSPQTSSNPQDYINAHRDEYEYFMKYGGENALQYMLSQFESGNAEGLRGQIMMRLCKELLGARDSISDESLSPQDWYNTLSICQETILPDYEYDGQDPIEKLVYAAEVEQSSGSERGGFTIVAPKIFGSYEEENQLKIFVTTFYVRYKLFGNKLSSEEGGVVPAAITYIKDSSGVYILKNYEQARDASEFAPSIREYCRMPVSGKKIPGLADEIIKHYSDYEDIRTLMYNNLFKHLKKNGIDDAVLTDSEGEVKFHMNDPEYNS